MNYYEKHLGDWAKDTAHLTMLEHGAYNLLADRYYGTEQGIPNDDRYRQARAHSPEEFAAVDAVLREFFKLGEDGVWRKGRIEEEIKRFQDGEPARQAKREAKKSRQDRWREERAKLFETLREHGITPAFDTPMDELKAQVRRVSETHETGLETTTHTHFPDTSNTSSTVVEDVKRGKRARKKADVHELWMTAEQMQADNPDLSTEVAEQYLAYRKGKKAPLSKIAWRDIVKEVRKVGRPIDGALAYAMNRGWQGFDATWVPGYGGTPGAPAPAATGRAGRQAAALADLDEIIRDNMGQPDPNEGGSNAADDGVIDVPARRID